MNGHQLYMTITLALALVTIVLLATLTDGTHIVTVIAFLGGWVLPSPKGGSGGRRPPPPAAVLALTVFVASLLVGCSPSALRQHSTAATVLTVATQGVATMVKEAAKAEAAQVCPTRDDACLAQLTQAWTPADAAVAATRAALLSYIEALNVARIAGDGADLWHPLALALARVVLAWDRLLALLHERGVEVDSLPPMITGLLAVLAGGA
jgi:hypothetical protein